MTDFHTGTCFCGAVEIEVAGTPEAMGYCYCRTCRSWSAEPVNVFTFWKPENLRVTKGAPLLGRFQKTEKSEVQFCAKCGGHLLTVHPTFGLTAVFVATLPGITFSPRGHETYTDVVLRMKDGLPRLKDVPAELVGSGIVVAG